MSSLAIHILVTVSIFVIMCVCLWNTDSLTDDSKWQSIREDLEEIKPLLSEDMYKRVSADAWHGGIFARCITASKKPLSKKDIVLTPVIGFCAIAFWPSVISTVFNLSLKATLGVAITCVILVAFILVDTAD